MERKDVSISLLCCLFESLFLVQVTAIPIVTGQHSTQRLLLAAEILIKDTRAACGGVSVDRVRLPRKTSHCKDECMYTFSHGLLLLCNIIQAWNQSLLQLFYLSLESLYKTNAIKFQWDLRNSLL